jgi:Uma2 family endonuclease
MASVDIARSKWEEFQALPVGPPNYEFIEGEIVAVVSPTLTHQEILLALASEVRRFVREHRLGKAFIEVDVYLPDGQVLIPDMGFLTTEHLDRISRVDQKIHGVPDLVVEVLSQDSARDRIRKSRQYHRNGIPWYWIVGQDLVIEELQHSPEGYLLIGGADFGDTFQPGLFPGLEINLTALLDVTEEIGSDNE